VRHRVYGKHLGRDKNQRTALFRGLLRSLILHESIATTETKAKAIKGLIDRLIVKSKEGTNASINVVKSALPQKEINKKLIEEIAPRYKTRSSGFTRTIKLGNRLGDGAMIVKMSLLEDGKIPESKKKQGDALTSEQAEKVQKTKKKPYVKVKEEN